MTWIFGPTTPRGDDDLDGELLSPLEPGSWPREPETWGRRSVISPHRAFVAAPTTTPPPGSDRGKSHGSLERADARPAPRAPIFVRRGHAGRRRDAKCRHPDLTRSSSSSSEEDDDAVTPLKLTTPTKSCLRPQSSCSSLDSESEVEAFEETQKSLRRAEDPRRVRRFRDKTLDAVVTIAESGGLWVARAARPGWSVSVPRFSGSPTRGSYAQMARSRFGMSSVGPRASSGSDRSGRAVIPGESSRGLGPVCEPETRLARASKIQQTARASFADARERRDAGPAGALRDRTPRGGRLGTR